MNKKVFIEKQEKKLIKLSFYLLIVNVISIIIMFFTEQLYSVGEYLPVKAFKGYIFFLTNVVFLILLTNLQSKLDEKKVFYPFYITFIILFIVLIIENINPALLNIFHCNKLYFQEFGRIRLLTPEASYTSTLIILNFIPALFYACYIVKKKTKSAILILMLIIFIVTSSSKGLFLSIFISMAIIAFVSKNIKIKYKIAFILILTIGIYYFFPYLSNIFIKDINEYTSTVTRTYCIISAIITSIVYPFGLGNGLYLPMYLKTLINNLNLLENISINVNTLEIYTIINSTNDSVIAAKSGLFQYAIYWGIIGTIYFISFLYNLYNSLRKIIKQERIILELGLLILIISIVFFIDFDCKYEVFSYLSIIIYYIKNNEEAKAEGN